jgi:hypothetical protein
MLRIVWSIVVVGCGVVFAEIGAAQSPARITAEGRLKFAAPDGEWNENNDINSGFGGGISAQIWLTPAFGVYGGWDWLRFTTDRPDLPHTFVSTAVDSGFRIGIIAEYLRGAASVTPFLFAGGMLNTTSFTIGDNREYFGITSNRELGREFGGGLNFPFTTFSMLTPSVSYRTHPATFGPPDLAARNQVTVSYVMFDLGMRVFLGQ